jgi:hypothetical protein
MLKKGAPGYHCIGSCVADLDMVSKTLPLPGTEFRSSSYHGSSALYFSQTETHCIVNTLALRHYVGKILKVNL